MPTRPTPSWWQRRWRLVLTAVAAALVAGGLVRLVTDQRAVEVVTFEDQ